LTEVILDLVDVVKKFDNVEVVKSISLEVHEGEFITLLGPSGCGKTTTLRMIAGFESPTSGTILLEKKHVEGMEPYERNVNTVFQNYALFPHMNIYENIAYSLKIKKVNKSEIKKRVAEMLTLVQLIGYDKRKPEQLSGGQRQRVAIARALINKPKVLLLDEPLGALDLKLRKQMQSELKNLQKKLGITFIYVTHDQEEAFNMSDRIAVMNAGVIEQVGTPKEIYETPKTRFVANFIGETNIFNAEILNISEDKVDLKVNEGNITILNKRFNSEENIFVSIRPENIKYSEDKTNTYGIRALIKEYIYVGSMIRIIALLSDGKKILINSYDRKIILPPCETLIWLYWSLEDMVIVQGSEGELYESV
jgi:spermidine/putrescine transport system ATP-binding protein